MITTALDMKRINNPETNVLIIGNIGSGKTVMLDHILQQVTLSEGMTVLEEVAELSPIPFGSLHVEYKPSELIDIIDTELFSNRRLVIGELHGGSALKKVLDATLLGKGVITTYHSDNLENAYERMVANLILTEPNMDKDLAQRFVKEAWDIIIITKRNQPPEIIYTA